MTRSNYTSDADNLAMWRGQVASAIRGRRGQKFLRDLIAALDAMPERRLIKHELEKDGEVCAIGALGKVRGISMTELDPEDTQEVANAFDIAHQLAAEVVYMNDEYFDFTYDVPNPDLRSGQPRTLRRDYTPEERWTLMRGWAAEHITPEPQP